MGCPARAGTHPAAISRRHASSSASWRRCHDRPQVLGPGPLPQRVQHRRPAPRCTAGSGPRPASRTARTSHPGDRPRPVNPSSPSRSGRAVRRRISSARAARSARSAPPAAAASKIASASARHSAGSRSRPPAHLPRPRPGQLPRGQRLRDRRVRGQPPHPRHRAGRGGLGDPGLPPQPHLRRPVPVILAAVPGMERGQHPRPRRDMHRLSPLQRPQAISLHRGGQPRHIHRPPARPARPAPSPPHPQQRRRSTAGRRRRAGGWPGKHIRLSPWVEPGYQMRVVTRGRVPLRRWRRFELMYEEYQQAQTVSNDFSATSGPDCLGPGCCAEAASVTRISTCQALLD